MTSAHHSDYEVAATDRCERALVTLVGGIGPWSDRLYLVGGLAPRFIVETLPEGVAPHVGTLDVDLVIGLAVGEESPEAYRTLQNNLERSGFKLTEPSFRWVREIDGVSVFVEFLCETETTEPGRIFRPSGEGTGSKLGAFNVRGANLVTRDFIEREVSAERLDGGGLSTVRLRVAGVLSYTVLKILAFQDRHNTKDAYDLIFTLLNYPGGPRKAGEFAASSSVSADSDVLAAVDLLHERFTDMDRDGPAAYSQFLVRDDADAEMLLKRQAVATVSQFLDGFGWGEPT